MTTTPTPEAVAASLTKAQRRALLWCHESGEPRQWEKGAETSFYCLADIRWGDPTKQVAHVAVLVTRADGEKPKGRLWRANTWCLTPLGLQVRALLQDQPHAE